MSGKIIKFTSFIVICLCFTWLPSSKVYNDITYEFKETKIGTENDGVDFVKYTTQLPDERIDEILEEIKLEKEAKRKEEEERKRRSRTVVNTIDYSGSGYYFGNLSSEEIDMMLRIGMCEAGGESVECVAHVLNTIMNRVRSPYFPNSIYGVLHQSNQFTPVTSGWFYSVTPTEKCKTALSMVMSGCVDSGGALYFECCSGSSWQSRNLTYLFCCDGVNFYK